MSTQYQGLSAKDLQTYLKDKNVYFGAIDGDEGKKTKKAVLDFLIAVKVSVAVSSSLYTRQRLAVCQYLFSELGFYTGSIDGLYGPNTENAIDQYQMSMREVQLPSGDERQASVSNNWPRHSQIEGFYGAPGSNHVVVQLPYPMKLAWDLNTSITRLTINRKCSESFLRVMTNVLDIYGIKRIQDLGLDLFGGCYNNRNMRGGGRKSTHAYAAALDFDPLNNPLRGGAEKATFSHSNYDAWWKCWEDEGWVSLGRERNFDWMHVQAVKL
jgi:peptidoglycan hydrolase-like protein with peptidoglycan-binding domain